MALIRLPCITLNSAEVAAKLNGVSYNKIPMGNGTAVPNPSSSGKSASNDTTANGISNSGSGTSAKDTNAAGVSTIVDKVLLPLVVVSLSLAIFA